MRRQTVLAAFFLLVLALLVAPLVASAQVPDGADTLADWQPVTPIQTFTASGDTLHVLGDSTWVAVQDETTVGCQLGPNGTAWVFTLESLRDDARRLLMGEAVPHDRWQAKTECAWYVHILWTHLNR